MIISDTCTINFLLALASTLASVIKSARKRCHSLEHHLLSTLELSYTIVVRSIFLVVCDPSMNELSQTYTYI